MRVRTVIPVAATFLSLAAAAAYAQTAPTPPPASGSAQLIVEVSEIPTGATAYSGEPFDCTISLVVTNEGHRAGTFYVVARLAPGSLDQPRAGPWTVLPGSKRSIAFRLQAWMRRTGIQGNRLPITVALVAADGTEWATTRFTVPFLTRPAPR